MKRQRLRGDRRGLTLIELVLTLTILALAGSLVSGALATGLRAWQSGLRSGRDELVARIVLERIAAQLRAAVDSPSKRDGGDVVAFDAAEDHLRFVTLSAAGAAPVQVFYGMREDGGKPHLLYREYPWPDKAFFGEGRPLREEKVVEVTGFTVSVAKRTGKSGTGDTGEEPPPTAWSPLDRALPASATVEIVLNAEGQPEPRHYRITVAIPTQRVP